jgi:hypothetical protein
LHAQHLELGLLVGQSAYTGDLSSDQPTPAFQEWHIAYGAFATLKLNDFLGLRLSASQGKISGNDANRIATYHRNLHFESRLWDFSLVGQLGLPFQRLFPKGPDAELYFFGGIGLYHFNPKAQYNGAWIELAPLATEMQDRYGAKKSYDLTQWSIPFGLGFKVPLCRELAVGLEFAPRRVFTDYLDDVSGYYPNEEMLAAYENGQMVRELSYRGESDGEHFPAGMARGNDSKRDGFWLGGITLTYRPFYRSGHRKVRCPRF